MKIYRTRTQEEFDWLGRWASSLGYAFYESTTWENYRARTVVYYLEGDKGYVSHEPIEAVRRQYPEEDYPIIEVSELMKEDDPLAKKIEERNNKPIPTIQDNPEELAEQLKRVFPEDDPIEPQHYRKGEMDLFEAWSKIYPPNEYRAGMQMIAMRYMFRDKDDRVQDLNKAIETLERLKEYEEKTNEKDN